MKKLWIFLFSFLIAFGIAVFSKKSPSNVASTNKAIWKTFEKTSSKSISGHATTKIELEQARIPTPKREIAQVKNDSFNSLSLPKDRVYHLREGRLLLGDFDIEKYRDENEELVMVNKINPDWKEVLGNDLLRFQDENTKVMIKEEFPVIRVRNGKGQYLEQVIVTYAFKNGNFSSFHALVDSDSGFVIETWDRTVQEKVKQERAEITLPETNNSGIIVK